MVVSAALPRLRACALREGRRGRAWFTLLAWGRTAPPSGGGRPVRLRSRGFADVTAYPHGHARADAGRRAERRSTGCTCTRE